MPTEKQYKYNTVINYLMKYIQENDLSDGDRLPTEQQLSDELHVSRVSIQQGIKRLEKDGFVYRIQGSGTYVRQTVGRKEASVMIPLVMNSNFNVVHGFDIIRGAQEYLFSHSCHLSPHCINKADNQAAAYAYEEIINGLIDQGNRCIMVLPPIVRSKEFFRRHMRDGVRFVFLDTPLDDFWGCHTVCSNHLQGGYLVTKHLLEQGHRHIAVISPERLNQAINPNFLHRIEGYRRALEEFDVPFRQEYVFEEYQPLNTMRVKVEQMLSMNPRPTAIFCLNDAVADGAIAHLGEVGMEVPQDISVAGFDNHEIPRPVTTVQQDFYGVGRYGAELALRLLNDPDYPITQQTLPVTLIKRATTAKAIDWKKQP